MTPAITLDGLAAELKAERVLLLSTMPSGDLRVLRVGRGTGDAWTPAMSRQFLSNGQFADRAAWDAIVEREPADDADEAGTRTIAVRLTAPLLAGYAGALVAIAGAEREPFDDEDRDALAAAATRIDADVNLSAPRRLGDRGAVASRLFIVDERGNFVGVSPSEAKLDPTLAGHVEAFARTRVADPTPATGGERVPLADESGQMQAFTIALHAEHAALAPEGGRVLFVMQVPNFYEWLELRPDDFAVDQEIGRLLPAFRFMKDRFQDGVILPAIAKHVSLSPFHFHRRFTELLGITPKHFLYDAQIARAQDYLLASTHELEEVAKLCGFAHQSHFTSRFKQATGLTPTRWRRLKLSGDRTAGRAPERV